MLHGPCGPQNPKSTCMENKRCTKYFPKKFSDITIIDSDGYPVYRRRDNGVFVQKGKSFLDSRFVVPYNRTLLLKYNAHINVEYCNQSDQSNISSSMSTKVMIELQQLSMVLVIPTLIMILLMK